MQVLNYMHEKKCQKFISFFTSIDRLHFFFLRLLIFKIFMISLIILFFLPTKTNNVIIYKPKVSIIALSSYAVTFNK